MHDSLYEVALPSEWTRCTVVNTSLSPLIEPVASAYVTHFDNGVTHATVCVCVCVCAYVCVQK